MSNKILIGIVSILVIFGLLFVVYKFTNTPQVTNFHEVNVIKSDDHIKWSPDRKNILVEYSDLQCPACKSFHDLIKSEFEATRSGQVDVTKKVTFVYRHFPLFEAHQYAYDAAYSTEAAGKQGKFFEMADMMFDHQDEWVSKGNVKQAFEGFAQSLKLDLDQFKKDRDSIEVKDRVQEDLLSGQKASVNGTPTFYLNGQKLDSIRSFDEFKRLLQNL